MKWTIRIELTPVGNEPLTRDVGTMTRPIADFHPEQVGLSPEEDRQVVLAIADCSSGFPDSASLELAREQYAYCNDIIEQGVGNWTDGSRANSAPSTARTRVSEAAIQFPSSAIELHHFPAVSQYRRLGVRGLAAGACSPKQPVAYFFFLGSSLGLI
jgi:hypothetical protein